MAQRQILSSKSVSFAEKLHVLSAPVKAWNAGSATVLADSSASSIDHARYINILTRLRGFRVKIANFSSFLSKKIAPNVDVWPESLGDMIEYWYIERGLLVNAHLWIAPDS